MPLSTVRNRIRFYGEELLAPRPTSKQEDHLLSAAATAHSIYSQLPSIFKAAPRNPQAGGPPLVCCLRLLIQYIRSYPQYLKPFLQTPSRRIAPCRLSVTVYSTYSQLPSIFLHPQPEDTPCRVDRLPLIPDTILSHISKRWKITVTEPYTVEYNGL